MMTVFFAKMLAVLPLLAVWTVVSFALAFFLAVSLNEQKARATRETAEQRRTRERGERALSISDGWRALASVTGLDGEAWTYEQAARHWETVARECGVVRPLRASDSEPPRLPSLPGKHAYEE